MNVTTTTENPSVTYFQGIIQPWQDYLIYRDNNGRDIAYIGNSYEKDGKIIFKNPRKVEVYRPNSVGSVYHVNSSSVNDNVIITVGNPYYTYCNNLPDCRNITLNNTQNITGYVVMFTCLLLITEKLVGGIIKRICAKMFSKS